MSAINVYSMHIDGTHGTFELLGACKGARVQPRVQPPVRPWVRAVRDDFLRVIPGFNPEFNHVCAAYPLSSPRGSAVGSSGGSMAGANVAVRVASLGATQGQAVHAKRCK